MKNIRVIALISVLALLVMTAGGASSRGAGPLETNAPTGTVAAAISYQGRLVHPTTGAPLSGTYDLEFTVWSADWPGGAQLGGVITKNSQSIVNGLYSTQLAADPTIVNGQEMWLQIRVRTTGGTWETLTPRVQVLPTAYAMSLRPGARIEGSLGGLSLLSQQPIHHMALGCAAKAATRAAMASMATMAAQMRGATAQASLGVFWPRAMGSWAQPTAVTASGSRA